MTEFQHSLCTRNTKLMEETHHSFPSMIKALNYSCLYCLWQKMLLHTMTLSLQFALHMYYQLFLCIEYNFSIQMYVFISFLVSKFVYGKFIYVKSHGNKTFRLCFCTCTIIPHLLWFAPMSQPCFRTLCGHVNHLKDLHIAKKHINSNPAVKYHPSRTCFRMLGWPYISD